MRPVQRAATAVPLDSLPCLSVADLASRLQESMAVS